MINVSNNLNHKKFMKYLSPLTILFFILAVMLSSCTKEVPKEFQDKKPITPNKEMPNDSIHMNLKKNNNTDGQDMSNDDKKGDDKADKIAKEADDADAQYQKTKSEADKKIAIEKQLAAANYFMFEANLAPKKKYRPALKRYKRVLELS